MKDERLCLMGEEKEPELSIDDVEEIMKVYHKILTNSVSNQIDGDIKAFEIVLSILEKYKKIEETVNEQKLG